MTLRREFSLEAAVRFENGFTTPPGESGPRYRWFINTSTPPPKHSDFENEFFMDIHRAIYLQATRQSSNTIEVPT